MIIRKKYKFEGAHIVRNCSSYMCRENIHGHSYEVEVFISGDKLDKGHMIIDFILLDKIKDFIDSFDHSFSLWADDDKAFKESVYQFNKRVAEIPLSPSAEGYALIFLYVCDIIIQNIEKANSEGNIVLQSVRVHETKTGYAEAFRDDLKLCDFNINSILFTDRIKDDWKDKNWWEDLKNHKQFKNNLL